MQSLFHHLSIGHFPSNSLVTLVFAFNKHLHNEHESPLNKPKNLVRLCSHVLQIANLVFCVSLSTININQI